MKRAKSKKREGKAPVAEVNGEPAGSLEASIMEMARSGELAKAAGEAIAHLRQKGLPITFQRGRKIIRQHADGHEEILGAIDRVTRKIPKGVRIIEAAGKERR